MDDRSTPARPGLVARASGRSPTLDDLTIAVLLAGIWWVFTDGSVTSWLVGLPALVLATWASSRLRRSSDTRISVPGLLRFIPHFLWQSLRGGVDVALRTLAPRMRIRPGFLRYRTALNTPETRTLFVNCVSLLPGTLAADLHDDWLEIHTLNMDADFKSELAGLEIAVARPYKRTGEDR